MSAKGWKKRQRGLERSTEDRLEILWWLYAHRGDGWTPLGGLLPDHIRALERRGYLELFEAGVLRAGRLTERGVRVAEHLRTDGCGLWRVA